MLRAEEWAARSEAERPRLKSQPTPHTLTPPTPPWPSSNASCVTYPGPSISLCVKWGRYQALLPGDESFIWDDIWNILSARPGKWNILSTGMETSDADCLSLVKTSLRGGGELCPGGSWGGGGTIEKLLREKNWTEAAFPAITSVFQTAEAGGEGDRGPTAPTTVAESAPLLSALLEVRKTCKQSPSHTRLQWGLGTVFF